MADAVPVDLEALQAQIDMSMSVIQDLATSWLHPSYKVQRTSAAVDADKEIEEYIKRPPRLGVGAPIPDSAGPSGREAARLRGRLVQNGRKDGSSTVEKAKNDLPSDDEEGEKGSKVTKKLRLDPFTSKKKTANNPSTPKVNGASFSSSNIAQVENKASRTADSPFSSPEKTGQTTGASTSSPPKKDKGMDEEDYEMEEWNGFGDDISVYLSNLEPAETADGQSTSSTKTVPIIAPISPVSMSDSQSSMVPNGQSTSPKSQRKRKRKRKKRVPKGDT